jgi:putative ABC transport system permease protein
MLGVAVAAAMLLDMVMMSTGMRESFRMLLLSRGFQLRVAPKGTLPFDTDATIKHTRATVARLRRNPDLTVSAVLGGTIHVPRDGRVITSSALGLDPRVQGDYELLEGTDPIAPNAIVGNAEFIKAVGARVGDSITVASGYDPQSREYSGARTFVLTGRVRFIYGAARQRAAAMQLETMQKMSGPERADDASMFMIRVREGVNLDSATQFIQKQNVGGWIISTETALAQVDERLRYFRQLAVILGVVSLFVGFLLVTTLITVSVNERIGEIAVMRALGVSRAHVVQQIVVEGVAISLVGAAAGLLLGLVTGRYLNGILSSFPGLPEAIDFFLFQPKSAWTALGLLALSGIAAGVYPSYRASSLPIATTLRQEAIA